VLAGLASAANDQTSDGDTRQAVTLDNLHNATWVSVTEFGAVGDCTVNGSTSGCTANAPAVQKAFDHCYKAGCAVYFPANPAAAGGSTIYYLGGTVNPRGVSFFGPPGAAGFRSSPPAVAVRGAPGKDVFAPGDPSSPDYMKPRQRFSVHDLAILVDNSVDASSSGTNQFRHRLPGRTVFDAAMTSGSAVLTSNTAYFQPGDVGQAASVNGAGSGGNLTAAIASFQSSKQVTLVTPASTTVSGARAYISVMNLSPTQTIGNCAWAYDSTASPGVENDIGSTEADFTHVNILNTDGTEANNTCAFFHQGAASPYQDRWEQNFISTTFGFMFVPSDGIAPSANKQCAGICDFNVIDHTWINSNYPFLAYGGNNNTIRDVQLSAVHIGPNILSFTAPAPIPWFWSIDFPEEEFDFGHGHACAAGWTAYRIDGRGMEAHHLGTPYCSSGSGIFQWDASASQVDGMYFNSLGPIDITGNSSTITALEAGANYPAPSVTGFGNKFITCASENPYNGLQAAGCQYAGLNPKSVGPALLSRGRTAFDRTHDFIDSGAANYFVNAEDLWLWPGDVGGWGGAQGTPRIVFDTSSTTGSALYFPSGSSQSYFLFESNGTRWTIGSQIPAGRMRIYFNAQAESNGTRFDVDATHSSDRGEPATSLHCAGTLTLTTRYAVYSCDVDTSGMAGDSFGIKLGGDRLNSNVQVAWIAINPWNTDFTATSATIGNGSTPMTGSVGNGGNAQETTSAKKTPGDLVAFDRNGNTVDSGIASTRLGGNSSAQAAPAPRVESDKDSNVSAAPNSQDVASVDPNPGDLLCAHAADSTIHAIPITGGKCDGNTCTLEASSIPADYFIPGQIVGVTGTRGVAGLNGGPYKLKSATPSSIVFGFRSASGSLSGGTFFRYCENQATDATSFTVFSKNRLTVAANSLLADTNYTHRAYMLLTTSSTAPAFSIQMTYGSSYLYSGPALNLLANQFNTPAQLATNLLPLSVSSAGVISSSLQSLTLSGANQNFGSTAPGIVQLDTDIKQTIGVNAMFAASGVASITSGSGGEITGAGTCILEGFNSNGSGARATVTFTTSGDWSGATFSVEKTGDGYSSAPTAATLLSGTAKCSDKVALATVLGGAEGNAVDLVGLQ
jgi:hypothetical protein